MEEQFLPIEAYAQAIEQRIYQLKGVVVQIKLPLQTDKEKELFIKAINTLI
jgi:hypothetical protein